MLTEIRKFFSLLFLLIFSIALWKYIEYFFDVSWAKLFMGPIELTTNISFRVPFLNLPQTQFINYTSSLALSIIIFYFLPRLFKKPFVAILFILLIYLRTNFIFLCYFISIFLFSYYLILKVSNRIWRWAIFLSIYLLTSVVLMLYLGTNLNTNFWIIQAFLFMGFLSTSDLKNHNEKFDFFDTFMLWTGFIGSFVMLIGQKEFSNSFLNDNYLKILRTGLERIFLGLSKIFVAVFIQYLFFPYWSNTRPNLISMIYYGENVYFSKFVFFSILMYIIFLVSHVGMTQLVQGAACIFGYNIKDQTISPWQSTSLLDFWRRTSYHNREYMIKHVFLPVYIKTRSLYLSNLSVWCTWALFISFSTGAFTFNFGSNMTESRQIFFSNFIKYSFLYANICYLELKFRAKITKTTSLSIKLTYKITILLLFILAMVIGNEVNFGPLINLNFFSEGF